MITNTMLCLKGLYPSLTPTERRLADYFISNAARLPQTPMLEIARACSTSKPAVVRLCKRLGFSGYKALLTTLSAEIAVSVSENRPDFRSLSRLSDAKDICTAVAYWQIASLEDTVLHVNADMMEEAVRMIIDAPRIDLCGIGSGGIAAQAAAISLKRLGMDVYACADPKEQASRVVSMAPNDVMIILSDAKPHQGLLKSALEAREKGARVISLRRRHTPSIAHACDVMLQFASTDAPEGFCGVATRTAMLCAVDMLITLIISRGNKHLVKP